MSSHLLNGFRLHCRLARYITTLSGWFTPSAPQIWSPDNGRIWCLWLDYIWISSHSPFSLPEVSWNCAILFSLILSIFTDKYFFQKICIWLCTVVCHCYVEELFRISTSLKNKFWSIKKKTMQHLVFFKKNFIWQ